MWIAWKQDKTEILQMNILKKGKKQDISNWNLANQEGNKNIKMDEIENLAWILLRSASTTNGIPVTFSLNLGVKYTCKICSCEAETHEVLEGHEKDKHIGEDVDNLVRMRGTYKKRITHKPCSIALNVTKHSIVCLFCKNIQKGSYQPNHRRMYNPWSIIQYNCHCQPNHRCMNNLQSIIQYNCHFHCHFSEFHRQWSFFNHFKNDHACKICT